jgi:nitroreductase
MCELRTKGKIMDFADLVKHRKSVRDFIDRPVEREKIMMCLEAARLAPSASNSQPWKFIIVDDKQLKNRLCDAAFGSLHFFNSFCKKAPVIVAIVSEKSNFIARIGARLRSTQYYLIDIGIAGEHFVLQAEELGLGTCWMGWFDEQAVKSILNVPEGKKVDVMLALGYYNTEKVEQQRKREAIDKMSSFNSY